LRARKFILAAGTLSSPLILMRSGVGEKSQLKRYRIPQVVDRPGVGENLHDHPGIGLRFEPSDIARKALVDDLSHRRFYQSQVILRALTKVGANEKAGFDLHILPYQSLRGFEATYGLLAFAMAPLSRGRLQLGGRDPHRKPKVDFAFLSDHDHHDLEVLLEAIPIIRRLAKQPALGKLVASEREPGARVTGARSLRTFVSRTVDGYLHPVGTCKMGPEADEMAVVDASGKVHGLENVYVADASIIPVIPRANTSLTAMLIGVKIAQSVSA
jgi:choline dehydrogenase